MGATALPTQRIEPAAAGLTFVMSIMSLIADALNWMSQNMAAISALAIMGGFGIQLWASRRNREKMDAEEERAQAEEKRAQEEHEIKMKILRGELPDRRTGVDLVEAVEK